MTREISYPKSKIKALLLENIHLDAVKAFKEEGYPIEILKDSLDEEDSWNNKIQSSILG
ncbi:hypothetical protein HQ533_00045 [Candidatus Woesearchaeota archaeon]|nr:hypothetical protein [Candidatus Woesearchaeota archaeon]